jgi:Uncharacterized conserved protein, contains double-stranded beta-helix domain
MPVVHKADIEWSELEDEETKFRRKQLGEATDGRLLGCSLYEIPPGRKSWPYHYHTANEEAIYVLSGTGTLRHDGEHHELTAGTYVSLPANKAGGHRVLNNSDGTLRYLAVSTMTEPDLTVYPDSEKFGVYVGSPPGGRDGRSLEGYYNIDDEVDYWERES